MTKERCRSDTGTASFHLPNPKPNQVQHKELHWKISMTLTKKINITGTGLRYLSSVSNTGMHTNTKITKAG
jgi:hypothetical protein